MFSKVSALRVVLVAAVFAGAGVAAQADQLQDIVQRKELRCGTFADVPPFAAPDPKTREMVGFDVDLCGAIAKELGVVAKSPKSRRCLWRHVSPRSSSVTSTSRWPISPIRSVAPARSNSAIHIMSPRKCWR